MSDKPRISYPPLDIGDLPDKRPSMRNTQAMFKGRPGHYTTCEATSCEHCGHPGYTHSRQPDIAERFVRHYMFCPSCFRRWSVLYRFDGTEPARDIF